MNRRFWTGMCLLLCALVVAQHSLASDWADGATGTNGTVSLNPGQSTMVCSAYGHYGESHAVTTVWPLSSGVEEDAAQASVSANYKEVSSVWHRPHSGGTPPYTRFNCMVVVDLSWNIGMDSDNWRWSAATTSAAGELWVKVDSEPDDPDVNEAITSRWDGSKTEQCELTGLGISVWGVSVSWDNDDDEWGDAPDAGDPVTNTWAGTMTNNDHGTYVDSVYLRVYSSASAAVSASDRPYGGECMVCNSVNQLSLSLIP